MNPVKSTPQAKLKAYTVEISVLFEIQLEHHFSDIDIQNSGRLITDAFNDLIVEIENHFSSNFIDIYFESAKRRRKNELYNFTGSIKRCYEFSEQDIDGGELVDGVFESQLEDMRLAVETACDMSGYELTIINFSGADDEVIDEN